MESTIHSLNSLFKQLGLDNSTNNITQFIEKHRPIPVETQLHKAKFWNVSQSAFLKEAKDLDADWAEIVDKLDALLR
jgi:hypothetical protein